MRLGPQRGSWRAGFALCYVHIAKGASCVRRWQSDAISQVRFVCSLAVGTTLESSASPRAHISLRLDVASAETCGARGLLHAPRGTWRSSQRRASPTLLRRLGGFQLRACGHDSPAPWALNSLAATDALAQDAPPQTARRRTASASESYPYDNDERHRDMSPAVRFHSRATGGGRPHAPRSGDARPVPRWLTSEGTNARVGAKAVAAERCSTLLEQWYGSSRAVCREVCRILH